VSPDQVIGALNLFRASSGAFAPAEVRVGQALGDMATISLLRDHARARNMRLSDLAQAVIDGTQTLTGPAARRRQPLLALGKAPPAPPGLVAQAVDPGPAAVT
jgi:hypothetical protein